MTIWDGHGRTPHDTLEQFLSAGAMILCLPCLICSKIRIPGTKKHVGNPPEPTEPRNEPVVSKSMNINQNYSDSGRRAGKAELEDENMQLTPMAEKVT
ncbi:hypothetical protein BT63DRAFT_460667 [Microthyrium microscopicum]|uniref:Uncharacterized protein n=1 Tax=Microthyrium microscopicum TaxID=703497 RepID=A0A6A6TY58_9PEZI|nr:hypothetical protein BT63DRAFT_460667 [Microthyrium microscopicum]